MADPWLAVPLAFLAAFLFNAGVIFQKKGMEGIDPIRLRSRPNQEPENLPYPPAENGSPEDPDSDLNADLDFVPASDNESRPFGPESVGETSGNIGKSLGRMLRSRTWVFGSLVGLSGAIPYLFAMNIGQLSAVQTVVSGGIVFLAAMAVFILHERLSRTEWMGVTISVTGMILIGLFSSTGSAAPDMSVFIVFYPIIALTAGVEYFFAFRAPDFSKPKEVMFGIAGGQLFGLGAILTKTLVISLDATGSLFSAGVLLSLLGIGIGNLLAVFLLQIAFQKGRAMIILPVQTATSTAVPVVAGILIFAETLSLGLIAGIMAVLAGVALLSRVSAKFG